MTDPDSGDLQTLKTRSWLDDEQDKISEGTELIDGMDISRLWEENHGHPYVLSKAIDSLISTDPCLPSCLPAYRLTWLVLFRFSSL
ncbi:uncharacterized protein BO72DRAFT_452253 [Aspergillus fijiensis CBS 313.89]|uniref:Uncharacterized protein n=1 Tax=Aspergillus fijiensis CBS 313.89 TaxID=1448319 RepID=A0A8G1RI88_9EURO|nr:uncharacterized protein BO72DRAFT_452253 [Aspergillus fijiensis CBS 313.89]RAK72882.1 hypothetical protein BO72DRAFT_452253 [Aspergillus fijiensis CBS 313.89]